jgi:acyl carrier protein
MLDMSNWHVAMVNATSHLVTFGHPVAVSFGLRDSIPTSIIRESGLDVLKWRNAPLTSATPTLRVDGTLPSMAVTPAASAPQDRSYPDHSVAVVGMACRFPGADSLEEFWDLLSSGGSMCQEMPADRFSTADLRRSPDGKLKFFGNFIRDADAFDHRFFKKSSREAASMDPQQRILLEVAYAAMESSGYFGGLDQELAQDIGVYIGACSNDYNDNVASHSPNAFSSLGTLRAFLSGRISHWFDWTGPSITYDTACSSSAVAIDAACKAIQVGDCSQAIAGGVSLYTNPNFYQNLAAASFLSPTGPTKPFDSRADGYCRGEGIGLVVLKKLSAAVADGDNIIGVIAGSAVNQNRNCTYITVPHGGSQQNLYEKVARQAAIMPKDVSYVEAHGTGTPVGDPIEFESISKVFANESRPDSLRVASVKGNIGHLEGAAGVAALIKVCLMLQMQQIPKQANFITLNPKIAALGATGIEVPPSTIPWNSEFRAACINNYGAAGSNAALIVRQGPSVATRSTGRSRYLKSAYLPKYPIYISAGSMKSLSAYATALSQQIQRSFATSESNIVGDVAFNLANKQNRKLPFVLSTSVSRPEQLLELLGSVGSGDSSSVTEVDAERKRPVVLCFGGQVSDFVGLDKEVLEHSSLLRIHLDDCDASLRAANLPSLYPGIFQAEPVRDVVSLHSMLFSLQYATAKAWMDSGLHVDAIIGHSFGQLTALCVSGSLSLSDALKLICGRASLMKTHWGSEAGSMISLQADSMMVANIISSAKSRGHDLEIACYNGSASHVLVGTSAAIDAAQQIATSSNVKSKQLQVTNGFHSRFTEPLLGELRKIAEGVTFHAPKVHLETCSDGTSWVKSTPQSIVDHTRTAVYFGQAVQRLSQRLGACTWIEAGSSSSITAMVRSALDRSAQTGDAFVPVSLRAGACGVLADATVSLWTAGYPVQFWPFDRRQRAGYANINLPPYQFERSKHWLEWKDTVTTKVVEDVTPALIAPADPVLLTFNKFLDKNQEIAEFTVDPRSKEYVAYVQGHAVLAEPLCPAPLYVELVAQAARKLSDSATHPTIEDLEIKAPLGLAADRVVTLTLRWSANAPNSTWSFEFTSQLRDASAPGKSSSHATGVISLSQSKKLLTDFQHYERLVSAKRFTELRDDYAAEAVQGSMIYKVFEKVVTYASYYRGVRSIFSKDRQVAGTVMLPPHENPALDNTITHPLAVDNFFQVAGLHVNSLNAISEGDVFVCTQVDSIRMKPDFSSTDAKDWIVYSTFAESGDRELVNDIFVFDTISKKLVFLGLGAHFTRVSISSLTKVLSRANNGMGNVSQEITQAARLPEAPNAAAVDPVVVPTKKLRIKSKSKSRTRSHRPSIGSAPSVAPDVRKVLAKVAEIPESDVKDDSTLDDLGIDSLMIMEVLTEVQNFFKIEIPGDDWQTLSTPKLLADYLTSRGCRGGPASVISSSNSSNVDSSSSYSGSDSDTSVTTNSSVGSMNSLSPAPKLRRASPSIKPKPSFLRHEAIAEIEQPHAVLGTAQQAFEDIRYNYDSYASQTGFAGFWKTVYPLQAKLVLAYTVEAFHKLGSDLSLVDAGETVPSFKYLDKYDLMVKQLYNILEDASLVASNGNEIVRTEKPVDMTPSGVILQNILRKFPQHADEHKLLHITGSRLAECLAGTDDAIKLLFRDKANKELLERVYQLGPMYEAITRQLGDFLARAFVNPKQDGVFHILELGGGTGGTTKHVIDYLTRQGVEFTYTFTDISGALVTAARKKFSDRKNMEFTVIDIEKAAPQQHLNKYHVILSTNCIHATRNLTKSTGNMRAMLRPDGFVSVVEFTRNMFWFDLVFGLLDGWWFFQDGRKHVLADQWFWDSSMRTAGFKHVTWTDGASEESQTLRIITAFAAEAESHTYKVRRVSRKRRSEVMMQTVRWKQAGNLELMADIYFPSFDKVTSKPRPVGKSITLLKLHPDQD